MMTIIEKFKKLFERNNNMDTQVIYKNSTNKYSMTADCTLQLSTTTDKLRKDIDEKLKALIKKYIDNPEKLIQYIRFKGANVYKADNIAKILSVIGEEEGFIMPQKGIKAVILSIILSKISKNKVKISCSTPEMLVFNKERTEIYTIARALHKYYGFKNKLPGFDEKSQAVFKKIYGRRKSKSASAQLQNVDLKSVLACRDALARDLDSINFVLQLSLEHERSKKVLNKIKTEKNAKI